MRFLVVNREKYGIERINVNRIVKISSYGNKVRIVYDIGGDYHHVAFEVSSGSAEHVADMIMNRIAGGEKIIDLRDIEKAEFVNALELAKKSGIIIA